MKLLNKITATITLIFFTTTIGLAEQSNNYLQTSPNTFFYYLLALVLFIPTLFFIVKQYISFKSEAAKMKNEAKTNLTINEFIHSLNQDQLENMRHIKSKDCCGDCSNKGACKNLKKILAMILFFLTSNTLFAQTTTNPTDGIMKQPGIIITIILVALPLLIGVIFAISKAIQALKSTNNIDKIKAANTLAQEIDTLSEDDINEIVIKNANEKDAIEEDGIILNASNKNETHFTALKKKSTKRPSLDADITKLILWYIGCAAFWLLVGTAIGEYLGIKFVAPDADHISWLSFGRLRPVHTNIVFWGWASLGMIGLGYYVVPTVSNTKIYSIKWGWIALVLTNLMVIFGSICLMSGFNNGGGEFREYVWPVMALFAGALILTVTNFIKTVAKRTTKEIYISNWYIISALIFTIIVALTAYLPFWQDGVSETIVQGYFMHSGVGMWFTLYTLGLMYYFIPQQINKPIYAYSLGILAFWTQIIFYTVIGTHHFTFAPIPWWLQTVGIVGSMGMIIPVTAATINFVMTFKGQWSKVSNSYTLPFFFVAVIYYFVVSMQGTAEAFKFTNLIWHFTDFTVAHAHLGFYGIITFALWGGMYAIVPRLTGKEPPQYLVGAHFW
jgi:cytochrome c oxidase cbb3-type subunit 1